MVAIIDILLIEPEGLDILKKKYPNSMVLNPIESQHTTRKCVIVIPEEEYDDYCDLLLERGLAMSSNYFVNRIKRDKKFADKVKVRLAELVENL